VISLAEIYMCRVSVLRGSATSFEGTSNEQLAKHGLGHYHETQMPGQLGNFAVAGHRSGYGEPLAHVDELQEGDAIVVRTKDYWYVYHYTTSHRSCFQTRRMLWRRILKTLLLAATKRMITLDHLRASIHLCNSPLDQLGRVGLLGQGL
jgi:hypothetical protein